MGVQLWVIDTAKKYYTDANVVDRKQIAEIDYAGCVPLSGVFPDELEVKVRSKHLPADYIKIGLLFIVSRRLKEELNRFGVKAEYFKLRMIYQGRVYEKQDYYFLNCLDSVDCFDFGRSTFTKDGGAETSDYVDEIASLVIDEKRAVGYHLFRLAKVWDYIVCVSDELAQHVESVGLTGMRFVPPSMLHRA